MANLRNNASKNNVRIPEEKGQKDYPFSWTVPRYSNDVIELLRKGPMGYNELYEELRKCRPGVSKSTFNKCIKYLTYIRRIEKEEVKKGIGGKVRIYLNDDSFIDHIEKERRHFTKEERDFEWIDPANGHRYLIKGESQEHYLNKWKYCEQLFSIDGFLDTLFSDFIDNLYMYSISEDRDKAAINFDMYMKWQLLPMMYKLTELVRPPLTMSEDTCNKLRRFHSAALHADILRSKKYMPEDEIDKLLTNMLRSRVNSSHELDSD